MSKKTPSKPSPTSPKSPKPLREERTRSIPGGPRTGFPPQSPPAPPPKRK